MATQQATTPLGEGWLEVHQPSGPSFYVHQATNRTQWERPVLSAQAAAGPYPSPAPAPSPSPAPQAGAGAYPAGAYPVQQRAGGGRGALRERVGERLGAEAALPEGFPPERAGQQMVDGRTRVLNILLTSRVLRAALPDVRRRVLAESVRGATTVEVAMDILLENVASSPYLPQERKDPLAELAMTHQFDALAAVLQCDETLAPVASPEEEFRALRQMVVAVFTRSRKMQGLPAAKRHQLGAAICTQQTADDIKMLALSALQTSQAFDGVARDMVANDILDCRYDRLLLPDRFDCDEEPRRGDGRGRREAGGGAQATVPSAPPPSAAAGTAAAAAAAAAAPTEEAQECPVCLGTTPISAQLPCGHQFCRGCIEDWAQRCPAGQDRAGCPLCRAPFSAADISDAIAA
jgi:hypothetical protein